jgi:predicted small secreted protein
MIEDVSSGASQKAPRVALVQATRPRCNTAAGGGSDFLVQNYESEPVLVVILRYMESAKYGRTNETRQTVEIGPNQQHYEGCTNARVGFGTDIAYIHYRLESVRFK